MQVETRISAIEDNVNKLPTKVKKKKQPKNKTGRQDNKKTFRRKKNCSALYCEILIVFSVILLMIKRASK